MSKKNNKTRQDFLLTFFGDNNDYEEKQINGFWLVKRFKGNNKQKEVAIFTQPSFAPYKNADKIT